MQAVLLTYSHAVAVSYQGMCRLFWMHNIAMVWLFLTKASCFECIKTWHGLFLERLALLLACIYCRHEMAVSYQARQFCREKAVFSVAGSFSCIWDMNCLLLFTLPLNVCKWHIFANSWKTIKAIWSPLCIQVYLDCIYKFCKISFWVLGLILKVCIFQVLQFTYHVRKLDSFSGLPSEDVKGIVPQD